MVKRPFFARELIHSGLSADKNTERTCIMKIHLKGILTAKRLIVLSATLITIIGTVLIYFLATRSSPDRRSSNTLPDTKPIQVASKPRQTPIRAKIAVITPVNVVDDAFKGYDLNKGSDAESHADDEQKPVQDKSAAEAACEELAGQTSLREKAAKQPPAEMKQERMKEKEANPQESTGGVSATSPVNPTGRNDASGSGPVAQDEGLKLLNERLVEAGLSEASRKKMVQSYLELRKVLPEKEAQKMIMWKVAHERK